MGGRASFNGVITQIRRFEQGIKDDAERIVKEFAHDGERAMEKIIQESITETGIERVNANFGSETGSRSPGRIDTGLMINSVNSEFEVDGDTFTGRFGWTKEVEDYFLYQENGTRTIEAMHALFTANLEQREIALKKIHDAARRSR